jgi:phospholipid/cholesterol/gamma-HCH transport system substrate-binding protein
METDKNYFVVGSFVLVVLGCAIAFGLWMAGSRGDSNYRPFRIHFAQSVSGLDIGSPVKFRGVSVGKVKSIQIDALDTRLIQVDVEIVKTAPIKTDTVATLKLQGITGTVYIELTGGGQNAANLMPKTLVDDSGSTAIPEIPAEPSSIDAIINQTPEILKKVATIAGQVNKVLSDKNIDSVDNMVEEMDKLATSLQQQTGELDQLLRHSDQAATDMRNMLQSSQEDVRHLTHNLEQSSIQLNQLIAMLNKSAGNQSQQFYQLLTQLKTTSRDISDLSRKVEEDPSHILLPTEQKGIPVP